MGDLRMYRPLMVYTSLDHGRHRDRYQRAPLNCVQKNLTRKYNASGKKDVINEIKK